MINITSKYAKYILPILLILLFAGTASALPTATHDTVRGEMYVSSTANWDSHNSTNNFNVPNGTVVFARYYVGVWTANYPLNSITTTFNGHAFETNPSYYISGMGVTWIPYDVTDYVQPGKTNNATVDTTSWGDGRQYGTTLVVVLQNESKPQTEYWITEGLDWLHEGSSNTTMAGTVNLAKVQNASLYSIHLTGFNYEDLNGNSLPSASKHVSGSYFDYLCWNNIQYLLVAEDQSVNSGARSDNYCSVVFHALSITYKEMADLVPVSLTPTTVDPNISNTLTATIKNQGDKDSTAFNVSLLVDGTVVDTQPMASLASGGINTVEFHWTPDGTKYNYTLNVSVDPENAVVESGEDNNNLEVLVSTTSATVPVANFTANSTSGAAAFRVQFNDTSSNSPTEWLWDFGDRTTSTKQNPAHTYSKIGTYTVTLTATNFAGSNTATKTGYITATAPASTGGPVWTAKSTWDAPDIGRAASPDFADLDGDGDYDLLIGADTNPAGGYAGFTYAFENTGNKSSPVWTAKNEWIPPQVGDNAAPRLADLDGDGDYDLLIGANNGVTYAYENTGTANSPVWTAKSEWNVQDIGTKASPRLADLDGDKDYDLLIGENSGITYGFENTGNVNSPVWTAKPEWNLPDLGRSASPGLADLDGDGDYDLLLGVQTIQNDAVTVTYGYENTGNASNPVWTAKSAWNAPDIGTYSFAVPCLVDLDNDGDYDLLLGSNTGVTFGFENTGVLGGSPDLIPTNVTLPSSVNPGTPCTVTSIVSNTGKADVGAFVATLSVNGATVDSQNVLGPAAGSGTLVNFTWTPESAGDCNLTVTADPENVIAESDETNNALTVLVTASSGSTAPVANFTADVTNGTAPLIVNFTDQSTGSPTSWFWDFGDGTNSTEQNVSHTYTSAGNYTVNLTVANAGGSDSEVKTEYITVSEPLPGAPVADFSATPTSGDSPLTVQFTDASTGTVSSYSWDFDNDGSVDSNEQNPVHTYAVAGDYTVNLTVIGPGGSDSEVKTGYINVTSPSTAKPVAAFSASPTSGIVPLTVTFTDNSEGTPATWTWDFGDGTSSTEQNPVHTYSKVGKYTVSLTVENAAGSNSTSKTSYINVATLKVPVAAFSAKPTSGNAPLTVIFTDKSTNSLTSWKWNFGDGNTSTEQNPVHVYNKAGKYTVKLTVKNAKGSSTTSKSNYIYVKNSLKPPTATFYASPTSGKAPLTVNFTDKSTNSPASWKWTFGDGTSSTEQNPAHTYSKVGQYNVKLTVKNAAGSSTTLKSSYIKVTNPYKAPTAAFSASPTSGKAPLTVTFTDKSTNSPTSWTWTFGDGTSSTEQNPVHIYSKAGKYTVKLKVKNPAGSSTKTLTKYIVVSKK